MTTLARSTTSVLIAVLLPLFGAETAAAQVDFDRLKGMTARSIGPAGMSGRIGAIDAVDANPNVIYVGTATGGLWKSTTGGVTWTPVMDDLPASSIGAVTIHQPAPDLVWVGTGERNRRNSAGVGTGVYRTLDGGKTWAKMGLDNTGAIDAILIHPMNPDVVYVGALGNTWADSEDRGVYKTSDGGKTWTKILYVNPRTGAGDLVMDPSNPNHLIASMWEHRRWPWFFTSGGPGGGLHVTYDGGETWKELGPSDGLPQGELGRVGLDFARGNPDVVYAVTEAKRSVMMRSENGGDTWTIVNRERGIAERPFYYGQVRVDPTNENRVYNVHGTIDLSEDGGKTFRTLLPFARVHVDHHAFWVGPTGELLIDGNDGGVYISRDRGQGWLFVETLPLAQFYHINVDMAVPFNVYGGLQDNGSWKGPSHVWHNGGIRYYDWSEVAFGDGFATVVDPKNGRYGYAMSQGGFIVRFDTLTGERKSIRPAHPDGVDLRFHWNAGIGIDPFDGCVYYGSQFVHRSCDMGNSWTIVSPDLTTNDPEKQRQLESGGLTYDVTAAENHTTILTIAPSPVERGVIWVGTDDGNVQLTRDGGATWTNMVGRIRGVPAATWVPHIEPSKFERGTAFVVFDDHRRGNNRPYLFRTTDYGRSWSSLATADIEPYTFLHAVEQDPVNPRVLYLGSEYGMYVSLDGGAKWTLWRHGLPRAPVRALIVHPRDHDLVIGTHGRAAYVLDDVRPLRALASDPAIAGRSLHLFEIPPAIQYEVAQVGGIRFLADGKFEGENRPYGALLSYWIGGAAAADTAAAEGDSARTTIEVLDAAGELVRRFRGPAKAGLNRTSWNLRMDGPRSLGDDDTPAEFLPPGPSVLPGSYTIRVSAGADTVTGTVVVQDDDRLAYPMAERREKLEVLKRAMQRQNVAVEAVTRLRAVRKGIDAVLERTKGKEELDALHSAGDSLGKRLKEVEETFTGPQDLQGIAGRPDAVVAMLGLAYGQLGSSQDAPTQSGMLYLRQAEARLEEALEAVNAVLGAVGGYKDRVREAGVELLEAPDEISMDWRPDEP
ncbi:MAG: hypothetical protein OEO20_13035 [Gemmatimonadota bacterium]|nr:hypothetical protein [Gemmatimonadota bacterium]MDH3366590.1 hypothetical protein [Gemmatimonadota bacterium]MDH3479220.1 hypothetical protein [Gemmatimonadota bacterium]MDH3569912.1 hypothetical protein [Gemmatimonadota bacterium]MDH5548782.1 hypothetical protein [Gemmatimonadota bacterium]